MKLAKPYFNHDITAEFDPKIERLIFKLNNEGYGLYWRIVERIYRDELKIEDVDFIAYKFNCSIELIKSILNDFELFYVEDGKYTSDRIKWQIEKAEAKSRLCKKANSMRKNLSPDSTNSEEYADNSNPKITAYTSDEVLGIYNSIFDKPLSKIGQSSKEYIEKLTEEITLDEWKIIFKNAKRGWIIEGKKVEPSFKTILQEWDSFLNDNYNLAIDTKKAAEEEARKKEQIRLEKEKAEKAVKEIVEYEAQERDSDFDKIENKDMAISYIRKYYPSISKIVFGMAYDIKKLKAIYPITFDEVQNA